MKPLHQILGSRQSVLVMAMIALAIGIAIDKYRESSIQDGHVPIAALSEKPRVDRSLPAAQTETSRAPVLDPITEPKSPGNLFAVRTWEPPRPVIDPKTLPPVPPPPPQAPPLPFRFLGKIVDPDAGSSYLLTVGNRVVTVKIGDLIDNTYRVESVTNGQLTFLYQPMNIRQTLNVGSDS